MQKITLIVSVISLILILTLLGAVVKLESRIISIEQRLTEPTATAVEPPSPQPLPQQVFDKEAIQRPVVGKPFPVFEFTDLNGQIVNPGALKGKVVLVDFWATWCGPCTAETPYLLAVYEQFKDHGLEIIGISLDKDRPKLERYIEHHHITWPNYFDGKGWDNALSSRFGVHSIPQIILIDREGIVRETGLRGEQILTAVAALMEKNVNQKTAPSIKPGDWQDEYIVELTPVNNITSPRFEVDWFRPHAIKNLSPVKPDCVKKLPAFRHEIQQYMSLTLGDAPDNRIIAVADFDEPEQKYFPFDLYLDKNQDGELDDDFIANPGRIYDIPVPYKDGTTEPYSVNLYSFSGREPFGFAYQVLSGRSGFFPAGPVEVRILVIDNNGNGLFNDPEDVVLPDWDLDGKIDGSHQADGKVPLYSLLKLPGASYQVVEFDPPGRRMILRKAGTASDRFSEEIEYDAPVQAVVDNAKKEMSTSEQYSNHGAFVYRVRSADGNLRRARTELHYTGLGRGGYRPGSADEGEIKVIFERPGQPAELRVIHPDYHEFRRPIIFENGRIIVWDDIVLERVTADTAGSVKGRVRLEDDADPSEISVFAGQQSQTITDDAGEFVLNNLRSGEVLIAARKPGYHGLNTRVSVDKGQTANAELMGYRIRKANVRWAFQPDGSRNLSGDGLVTGTATLEDNVLDRVSFSEGFQQVNKQSDFLIYQDKDALMIKNFDVGHNGPAFCEVDCRFDELVEAPDSEYSGDTLTLQEGSVYVFRTYDENKFAKLEVLEICD